MHSGTARKRRNRPPRKTCLLAQERTRALQDALEQEQAGHAKVKHDLDRVVADYDALKHALDQRNANLSEEKQSFARMAEELQILRVEKEQLAAEMQTSEDQSRQLAAEMTRLREELGARDANAESLERERTHLHTSLDELAKDRELLELELSDERQRQAKLAAELHEAREALTMMSADARFVMDLRQEQKQLKMSLHESSERIRVLYQEREVLTDRVTEGEDRIAALQATVEQQGEQVALQQAEIQEKSQRILDYVQEVRHLGDLADQRVAELQTQFQTDSAKLQSANSRLEELLEIQQADSRVKSEQIASYELQIEELQGEIERYATQVYQLTGDGEEKMVQLKELYESQLKHVRTSNLELEEELSQLQLAANQQESRVATYRSQVEQLQLEIDQLQTENVRHPEQVQRLTKDHEQTIAELHASYRGQLEQLRAENTTFADKLRVLAAETAQKSAELTAVKSQLESLRAENAATTEKMHQVIDTYQQELREATNSHQGLTDQLQGTIKSLRSAMTEMESRIQAEAQEKLAMVDRTHRVAIENLKLAQQQELAEIDITREQELREARARAAAAEQELDEVRNRTESLVKQSTALQEERVALDRERDELASQLAQATQRIETMASVLDEHQGQIRDVRTEKEEILHGLHREQDENARLRQFVEDAELRLAEYDAVQQELVDLRAKYTSSDSRLAETMHQLQGLEADRDDLNISLHRAERRIVELTGSVTRLEEQLGGNDNVIRTLRLDKQNITTQLERERKERTALERTLRVHVETLDQLRADSHSLESLLERQSALQNSLQAHADRLRTVHVANESAAESSSEILSLRGYGSQTVHSRRDPLLGHVYDQRPWRRTDSNTF